jgi:ABC-type molybdate transport system substrate-binding protein
MQRAFWATLVLAAAVSVAGCDNELDNTPDPGPAPTTTETFTGTSHVNGAAVHQVTISAAGSMTATLTEVAPDNTIGVGFALGVWNGTTSTCQHVITNDNAAQGQILTGNVSGPGQVCARVYDTGRLTGALNYAISITHP